MSTKAELLQTIEKKVTKKELEEFLEDIYLSKLAAEAKKEKHKGRPYEKLRKEIFG